MKLCNTSIAFLEDLMLQNSPTDALSSPSLQSKYCWTLESERDVATARTTSVFNQSLDYLTLEAQHNTVNENIFQFTNLLQITLSKCPSLILKRKCKPNQFPIKFWYDEECKELKRRVRNSGKIVKENPDIAALREQFWRLKKQLKTLIRKKKRQTARDIHKKLESFRTENPRQYIRKVSDEVQDESTKIPLDRFADNFRKLNDGPLPGSPVNAIPGHEYNDVTDDEISVEEVKSAINGLKKHKAPGIDTMLYNQVLSS